MIGRTADRVLAAAEALLALALAAMVVMVFGNVVLRYVFDSGITVSEELSRFLFVWITFIGAVVVMRRGGHLGFDLVVRMLPGVGRQACRIVSDLLMLLCCGMFLRGAWSQTLLNLDNPAPVSGVPLGWAYAAAVLSAVGLGLLVAADLIGALRGQDPPEPPTLLEDPGA
ncbi:TRAP-type C4-dicarboxylate transport system permease small subunit [Humitalea rosea]|uniref:TRAP transporter small permease protein n=1 Tax=Humitalea rosea TaxID=990373 RepID=A0A2W7IIF5_9PROT|nr:TRAP transporter small permease [Humitalea rosea]PZW44925.1 TRAP-type C4-dicarboxylate transport system permease small subunit [Humitalea rosea]